MLTSCYYYFCAEEVNPKLPVPGYFEAGITMFSGDVLSSLAPEYTMTSVFSGGVYNYSSSKVDEARKKYNKLFL